MTACGDLPATVNAVSYTGHRRMNRLHGKTYLNTILLWHLWPVIKCQLNDFKLRLLNYKLVKQAVIARHASRITVIMETRNAF